MNKLGALVSWFHSESVSVADKVSIGLLLCLLIPFIAPIILFPAYVFVFLQNEPVDKLIAVYPIVKHFYRVAVTMSVLIVALILLGVALYFESKLPVTQDEKDIAQNWLVLAFVVITLLTAILILFVLNTIPQAQYILHFLLALQRFLLYFFPSSEKYVTVSEKGMKYFYRTLYVLFGLKDFIQVVLVIRFPTNIEFDKPSNVFAITFIFLNVLQLISGLIYIPILISVRKYAHLASAKENKPQKYIIYQILTSLASRTHLFMFYLLDIFLTPLTIEASYLLCNRRNVQQLAKATIDELMLGLLCPGRDLRRVEPMINSTHV